MDLAAHRWRRPRRSSRIMIALVGAGILYLGYSYLGGSYGFYNLWKLQRQKSALRAELAALQVRQDSLRGEIQRLQNDSTYAEELARKKFYMGEPGTTIYLIAKEKP